MTFALVAHFICTNPGNTRGNPKRGIHPILLTLVIRSHWVPSLPNAQGKDKLWEEASPAAATSRKLGWVTKLPTRKTTKYTKDRNSPHTSKSFIAT